MPPRQRTVAQKYSDEKCLDYITQIREALTELGFDCTDCTHKDACDLALSLIMTDTLIERGNRTGQQRPDTSKLSGIHTVVTILSWLDFAAKQPTQLADTIETCVELLSGKHVPTITEQKAEIALETARIKHNLKLGFVIDIDDASSVDEKHRLLSAYWNYADSRYQDRYGNIFSYKDAYGYHKQSDWDKD